MPATPILSNGGTERGLPISCFLNTVADSLEGISDTWGENLWLAARGGGIGTSWSLVRAIGEKVGRVGESSGIVPFIKVMDSQTLAISQGSLRRGSAAVYLNDTHPEIEEFVEIRRPTGGDPNRRSLNIHHGVMLSDAFMQAVEEGADWNLLSPKTGEVVNTIKARDLWQRILMTRLETGEPYIVFSDTVARAQPAHHKKHGLKVHASNLCAEVVLPTGIDHHGKDRTAVCCLSSLNLEHYMTWRGNRQFLKDVLLFLDNVLQDFIDRASVMKGFERAAYAASRERSIGLGVMGFQSMCQRHGFPMESVIAKVWNRQIFSWLHKTGDEINEEVAKERFPCPDAWDAGIKLRWSHMFALAPTASISIIAGGASPCIEPFPANVFTHKTLSGSYSVKNAYLSELLERKWEETDCDMPGYLGPKAEWLDAVWSRILQDGGSVRNIDILTADEKVIFRTAFEIDQRWLLEHAADRAPYIDQAASNNLFILPDVEKRDLHYLHFNAWKQGIKSLYYCRSKAIQRAESVAANAVGPVAESQREQMEVVRKDYDE
jgi:ribonucleoside-diphosphate reductase alpha chain